MVLTSIFPGARFELMLKRIFCSVTALAVLGMSEVAMAEELVDLGYDSKGSPIFLQRESPRSLRFELVSPYGDGMLETSFSAECGDSTAFLSVADIYSASGRRIEHLNINKNSVPPLGSPVGKALKIVCQSIGAAGW